MRTLAVSLHANNGIRRLFRDHLYDVLLVQNEKPDHIHVHFGLWSSSLAMLIHLITGIQYTFTTHRHDIYDIPPSNYRIKSQLARKHITVSKYNKGYLMRTFNIDENHIEVIHCGVDPEKLVPCNDNKEAHCIVSVARLATVKGLDILIDACHELKKRECMFQCYIAGEGPERSTLERLIDVYGLTKNVHLLGDMVHDDIIHLVRKASVFVLPSRSEGIPVSIMEAMALRVPVISTDITGIPELVEHEQSGLLVPPNDSHVLAEKIVLLFKNEKLGESLSTNGYRKIVSEFNAEREIDKLISLWQSN